MHRFERAEGPCSHLTPRTGAGSGGYCYPLGLSDLGTGARACHTPAPMPPGLLGIQEAPKNPPPQQQQQQHGTRVPTELGTSLPVLPFVASPQGWVCVGGGHSAHRAQTGSSGACVHGGGQGEGRSWQHSSARNSATRFGALQAALNAPGLQPAAIANPQPWSRSGDVRPSLRGQLCPPLAGQGCATVGCSLRHPQPRGDLRIAAHTRPTADCPQGRSRP